MKHFALKYFFEDSFTPRGSDRFGASVPARLAVDGAELEIVIQNMSRLGFMATATESVPIGSEAALSFGDFGPFSAHVRWALADRIGCEFAGYLDWEAFVAVLLMSRTGEADQVREQNRPGRDIVSR